jgi:hypothetical protein
VAVIRARRHTPGTAVHGRVLVVALLLMIAVAGPPAAASEPATAGEGDVNVLAVNAGEPIRIVFAAPVGLETRTLTDDDLDVEVDGTQLPTRLQRLSADDLEVAVVLDTTLDGDELRVLQAAIVELALTLPSGASMRIVDAAGVASDPAAVPGPAIAAIRAVQPGTADELAAAVEQATTLLDDSSRGRTALLVVGRDLTARLDPLDDRPLRSLSYLIDFGQGRAASLLGTRAGGRAIDVDTVNGVLAATDSAARDLRTLYLAEVPSADADAQALTLTILGDDGTAPTTTLALDAGGPQSNAPVDNADGQDASQPEENTSVQGSPAQAGEWLAWLIVAGALIAMVAAFPLWTRFSQPPVAALPAPIPIALPEAPRRRRAPEHASRPQRPIAKLTPETRETLARAHLGLRRLAVASRETAGIVPDDMFRLTEARASAALSGHDQSLEAALLATLSDDAADRDNNVIRRAATALTTGWQHTAKRRPSPPVAVEINARLRGGQRTGTQHSTQPITPVRALNPLVEIGLEHMVLAAQPDDHAALVARAVTVVDVMRAARLMRPVLALSPFLLTDVARYGAACRSEPTDAAARDDWLEYFCEAIFQRSHLAARQLDRLRRLRTRYREAASNVLTGQLIDLVLAQPVVNVSRASERLSVPPEEARAAIATASEAGWLRDHADHEHTWIADEVLDVFASGDDLDEPA